MSTDNDGETIRAYHFGGWDFGLTPDGQLLLTIIYLDPKEEPKSPAEVDAAVRRITFRMPGDSLLKLGEAAKRVFDKFTTKH